MTVVSSPEGPADEEDGELPAGWELQLDENGIEYYWNSRLRTASWSRPMRAVEGGQLPEGWKAYDDDLGHK